MSEPVRVVHLLNQFFGGIGGEEAANIRVETRDGPVGPGRLLQQALGDRGTVVATVICGDNYFNEQRAQALPAVVEALKAARADVVVAGPAFDAGRYGLSCGEVCKAAQELGIPAVTGMHPENPGVLSHGREVLVVPTGSSPVEMPSVIQAMARIALKLASGQELGPAAEEGYLPRGIRKLGMRSEPASKRAVDMVLAKVTGQPFQTEVPIQMPDRVTPAPPVTNLKDATIALVTNGGLVRKGNPDRQSSGNPTRYYRHNVAELEALSGKDWEAYHGGYFNDIVNSNPNYILPLSFMRVLEKEGVVGRTHEWIFALPGVGTPVAKSRVFGINIARELKEANVDGVILVAT